MTALTEVTVAGQTLVLRGQSDQVVEDIAKARHGLVAGYDVNGNVAAFLADAVTLVTAADKPKRTFGFSQALEVS